MTSLSLRQICQQQFFNWLFYSIYLANLWSRFVVAVAVFIFAHINTIIYISQNYYWSYLSMAFDSRWTLMSHIHSYWTQRQRSTHVNCVYRMQIFCEKKTNTSSTFTYSVEKSKSGVKILWLQKKQQTIIFAIGSFGPRPLCTHRKC